MTTECYSTWTSCEFHGHAYAEDEDRPGVRVCTDCGDSYTDDEDYLDHHTESDENVVGLRVRSCRDLLGGTYLH